MTNMSPTLPVSPVTSDEIALEVRARNVLNASPVHELRTLKIERVNDQLCISGVLTTYYHKQLAQETLRRVCSETRTVIRNRTEVFTF